MPLPAFDEDSLWLSVGFTHCNEAEQSLELLSSINLMMEGRPQERRDFMRVVIESVRFTCNGTTVQQVRLPGKHLTEMVEPSKRCLAQQAMVMMQWVEYSGSGKYES